LPLTPWNFEKAMALDMFHILTSFKKLHARWRYPEWSLELGVAMIQRLACRTSGYIARFVPSR
jgi:hypothetical protein